MELTENKESEEAEFTPNANNPKKNKKRFHPEVNKKEEKEKRRQKRARIIIRNISYKATDETLRKHFEKYGTIEELNILKRPDGKLVGCAFIQYETVTQAAKAILKATNQEYLGRPVYVDWAVGKDEFNKRNSSKKIKVEEPEIKEEAEVKSEDESVKDEDQEDEIKDEEEEDSSEYEVKSEQGSSENEEESEAYDDEDAFSDDDEDNIATKSKKKNDQAEEKKPPKKSNDIKEGCTIFIKNVPFDATSDDLRKVCNKYGPVYYALINTDSVSGHSKGTGFVKFKTKESADLCLNAGEEFQIFNVVMEAHPALSRQDVREKIDTSKHKDPADSRNLYLAKEGLIMTGSQAAEGVSASDMAKRHKLEQVKAQILRNLNRFVSKNRLSIHNLPLDYDNDRLKNVIVKHTNLKPHECRVMRENKPTADHPQGKSKGFGFMSFKTHQEAITALRKLNNNPTVFGPKNRPIVGFSIEDRSVHNIKQKRLQNSRQNNPTYKEKLENIKRRKEKRKQKDSKSGVQGQVVNNNKKDKNPRNKYKQKEEVSEDFAGMAAKPGTFVRMRSNKKIKEQSREHNKKINDLKKQERRKKERMLIRKEKREIDRPKQGKKKPEKDNLSFLVDKYKNLINSISENKSKAGGKRKKWYQE